MLVRMLDNHNPKLGQVHLIRNGRPQSLVVCAAGTSANIMGGIKKKKTKRGIEHHKHSLEQTLEAPETYGVRVSDSQSACPLRRRDFFREFHRCNMMLSCADQD